VLIRVIRGLKKETSNEKSTLFFANLAGLIQSLRG
jgi:hypothetical protein